jgi:ABC-type glycerol-3-phosphate transport system substrate-binding protein
MNLSEWIGREIAQRYKILGRVGEGSMGQIYRAYDQHLETDVVLKFPVAAEDTLEGPGFLIRFEREVRSLVRLSHPHIVKVVDVGQLEGRPYVVMQYLAGGSLKSRLESGPRGEPQPMTPLSLQDWLPDVARALDFIHDQDHIHRDVKPGNILFDEHGNAFLGDFGIIKALAADDSGARENSQTAPGFLAGTPNYVAPEIVMGRPFDGRADQYALAMTVHEVLSGTNCMSDVTPSATIVNQTIVVPPPLDELVPEVPQSLSDAIVRGLAKDPEDRFESCVALAHEVMGSLSLSSGSTATRLNAAPHPSDRSPSTRTGVRSAPRPAGKAGGGGRQPSRRFAAAVALLALVLIAAIVGWGLVASRRDGKGPGPDAAGPATAAAERVAINVAFGTEKEKWLKEALAAFEQTPEGRRVQVNLVGLGSVEGAQAVLDGPGPVPIHVWSPASSAYRDVFEKEWRIKHSGAPILQEENLALTPMVFVLWKSRYEPFIKRYGKVNFQTIAVAMGESGGWASIGDQPTWGLFKFGHAQPSKSNSGLLTLVLMAYEFSHKERGLTTADVTQPAFQAWLKAFEQGVARPGGSLTHSTGTLMREMVLRGPSQYDCLMVYENLAIDYLDDARRRWGELQVVYPEENLWNEHPYYILNVPWSAPAQREAARHFLDFLISEPIQRRALAHGFRPGNPSVAVRFPQSPLVVHAEQGLIIDLPRVCEPPRAEIVYDLIASSRRIGE